MTPEVQSLEIFDDREEHMSAFIALGRNLLDEIILGLEQGGRVVAPKIQVLKNKYKAVMIMSAECNGSVSPYFCPNPH